LRIALFWAITQRIVVISYRRFGRNYRSYLQGSRILLGLSTIEYLGLLSLELGTNICLETSVRNHHYSLRDSLDSQPPGRGPVPGPGINYTGPREAQGNYNMLQDFISPVDNYRIFL